MKKLFILFLVIILQCLPISINPPFLQKQLIKDSTLIGIWAVGKTDSLEGIVEINMLDTISYLVSYKDFSKGDKDTVIFNFKGQFTKIDSQIILSLTFSPEDFKDENPYTRSLHIPGFFFTRLLKLSKNSLQVDVFDNEKMADEMDKPFSRIKHTLSYGSYLITDQPLNIRKFLSKCLKKKDVFYENPIILWRAQG
jgi:hypothetical protein